MEYFPSHSGSLAFDVRYFGNDSDLNALTSTGSELVFYDSFRGGKSQQGGEHASRCTWATYTYIHDLHVDRCTDTQLLPAHKVNHALGYTHIDADAHLDDYSRPPGASLKLFSRDLAKRERGNEMSIRGSENERLRESLNFNRMFPEENSHHRCVSSMPESHSFL